VSEYYPELFERRKRSIKDHEEWGKIKSMILLELMKGPDTRSGLKLKINERLKKEGDLPISIKTIVRHLRDPDKRGLIDKKIVRERKGLLELPLSNPEEIAKFIDELSKNKTIGPKVSYFVDRAFAEAFLSPYGDRFPNYFRIDKYMKRAISLLLKNYDLEEDKKENIIDFIIIGRIQEANALQVSLRGKMMVEFPPMGATCNRNVEEEESEVNEMLRIANELDMLSTVMKLAEQMRGELTTSFKVSYILTVMDKMNLDLAIRKDLSTGSLINILDLAVFHMNNEEIIESKLKEDTIKQFKELLFRAVDGYFNEDRSLNPDNAILNIHSIVPLPLFKEGAISVDLTLRLQEPIAVMGDLVDPIEFKEKVETLYEVLQTRLKKGLSDYHEFSVF